MTAKLFTKTKTEGRPAKGAPRMIFGFRQRQARHLSLGAEVYWVLPAVIITALLIFTNQMSPVLANWIAILLFLFGVPHGAIERIDDAPRFTIPSLSYTALYVAFGIVIFSSWLISPIGTFVLFLGLSAWHFGQSEPDIKFIGLWVIVGSCLIYPAQTLDIFALLTDDIRLSAEHSFVARLFATASLVLLSAEIYMRRSVLQKPSLLRPFFLIGVFVILPPMQAVAIYFFAFHGLGEFTRTIGTLSVSGRKTSVTQIVKLYGPATIPAILGAMFLIGLTYIGYVPVWIATGLSIAFIIPHMVPVEKLLVIKGGYGD